MDLFQTSITIDGVTYDEDGRADPDIFIDAWGWNLDGDFSIEFHERLPGLVPQFHENQFVYVTVEGVVVAAGLIDEVQPVFDPNEGWTHGYKTRGYKYILNQHPITAVDGTGTILFNLKADDEDYLPSFAGKTVGEIIEYVLTQHAALLTSLGFVTDATSLAQLAALTLVPPEAVSVSGERIGNAIETVLQRWARNVVMYIQPFDDGGTIKGAFRFFDPKSGTGKTLTMGQDPIDPVSFSRSITDCATRVVVRGSGRIFPAYVSLLNLTLTPAWDSTQQSAWTLNDFTQPKGAYDKGTIAPGGILSPTSVQVTSSNTLATWDANYWSSVQAWLYLHSSLGSALTYTESAPVTSNTTMTAGGTSTINLNLDLENAGGSAYDSYELIGSYAPLTATGNNRNNVYRLYDIDDPGHQVRDHLVKKFPTGVAMLGYTGDSLAQVNYPCALLVKNGVTLPATFKVLPATGQILFDEPTVKAFNTPTVLNMGGSSVQQLDDIYVLLAYSRGALTAAYPPDVAGVPQYAGSAYTGPAGLERTLYIDVDSWIYAGNTSQMVDLAQMHWESVSETILTGNVTHRGAYEDGFAPGICLNIAAVDPSDDPISTGLESANVPVRSFSLKYIRQGSTLYSTSMSCSSRRNPRTGDRAYVHPTSLAQLGFKFNWSSPGFDLTKYGSLADRTSAVDPNDIAQKVSELGSISGNSTLGSAIAEALRNSPLFKGR